MKIGLVTAECVNSDINHNVSQILKYLNIAQAKQIDYIFFGESFLQGFDSLEWLFEIDRTIVIISISSVGVNHFSLQLYKASSKA